MLDGILLLRGAFVRMEDYGLDAVARRGPGRGQDPRGATAGPTEILRLFEEDRERLRPYNRTDARLALEILERLRLVELAVERSRLTGLPLDRVASSIAAFDFLYLSRARAAPDRGPERPCRGRGRGAPERRARPRARCPGLYTNVVVLDFKSLYPSLIRTFEIDPLEPRPAAEAGQADEDPIVAPNGAAFSAQGHPQRDPRRAPAAARGGARARATPSRATRSRS